MPSEEITGDVEHDLSRAEYAVMMAEAVLKVRGSTRENIQALAEARVRLEETRIRLGRERPVELELGVEIGRDDFTVLAHGAGEDSDVVLITTAPGDRGRQVLRFLPYARWFRAEHWSDPFDYADPHPRPSEGSHEILDSHWLREVRRAARVDGKDPFRHSWMREPRHLRFVFSCGMFEALAAEVEVHETEGDAFELCDIWRVAGWSPWDP